MLDSQRLDTWMHRIILIVLAALWVHVLCGIVLSTGLPPGELPYLILLLVMLTVAIIQVARNPLGR